MRHFACIIFKTSFLNVKLLRDDLEKASRRFTRAKKALQPDLWLFGRSFRSGIDLKRKWRGGNSVTRLLQRRLRSLTWNVPLISANQKARLPVRSRVDRDRKPFQRCILGNEAGKMEAAHLKLVISYYGRRFKPLGRIVGAVDR